MHFVNQLISSAPVNTIQCIHVHYIPVPVNESIHIYMYMYMYIHVHVYMYNVALCKRKASYYRKSFIVMLSFPDTIFSVSL